MIQNIFTLPILNKIYISLVMLVLTVISIMLFDFFEWIILDDSIYYMQLAIFVLTTLAIQLFLLFILPTAFPKLFETTSQSKRYILIAIFIVFTAIMISLIYSIQYAQSFFSLQSIRFLIIESIITAISIYAIRHNKSAETIEITNKPIVSKAKHSVEEVSQVIDYLEIEGELLNESIKIPLDHFLYIKSSDNYSEFYYISENDSIESTLLRLTLKSVETQISYKFIVRNHKSYIVNLDKVTSLSGNANNAKLHFKNHDITLPVSRTKRDHVIRVLESLD